MRRFTEDQWNTLVQATKSDKVSFDLRRAIELAIHRVGQATAEADAARAEVPKIRAELDAMRRRAEHAEHEARAIKQAVYDLLGRFLGCSREDEG